MEFSTQQWKTTFHMKLTQLHMKDSIQYLFNHNGVKLEISNSKKNGKIHKWKENTLSNNNGVKEESGSEFLKIS